MKRSQQMLTEVCKKLTETTSRSGKELIQDLHRIDWSPSGSELIAQLEEAYDVLLQKPRFNSGKFSIKPRFAAYLETSEKDALLTLEKIKKSGKGELYFTNYYEGLDYFRDLSEESDMEIQYRKRGKFRIPYLDLTANLESENRSVFPENEFLVIDEGRSATEKSVVHVRGTHVLGYSFVDDDSEEHETVLEFKEKAFKPIPEMELVIRKYMEKGRFQKIVRLD